VPVVLTVANRIGAFVSRLFGLGSEDPVPPVSNPNPISEGQFLGPEAVEYLSEIAKDAYDQQAELNESVWRSLPFFAAVLGLAVTLMGRAAVDLPALDVSLYGSSTNAMFFLSGVSFAWAFRWLWLVLSSRDYEYPSDQAEVQIFAEQMVAYHSALGLSGPELDMRVTQELRAFRAQQLGDAARANLANNTVKLNARSQLLLFMMIGFLLAMATGTTTYIHDRIYPSVREAKS